MKAVNLIPVEERRGAAGGTGTPTYGLLGLLCLLVVAVTAWVVLSNQIGERKAEIAREQGKATAAQSRAASLKPYVAFSELSQKRVQTVTQLAQTRFDWEGTMRDLAHVVGGNVWITTFTGTVAPGVSVGGSSGGGGGGTSTTVRSALSAPAVELSGCATSNAEVARFLSRLRAMNGVTRVTITNSVKSDTATAPSAPAPGGAAGGASTSSGSDCTEGSDRYPVFGLVVFFAPLPGGAAVAPVAGGAAPAPATAKPGASAPSSSTPAPAGTASPASAGGSK